MNIMDTIEPKVDQLTADHLVGRALTIRITSVDLAPGDQPCDIHYEGENGLPYRPGKSMRRVLVHAWGSDVTKYVGRSLRLYRDDDVQFGGLKVGGVRISHMSHIDGPLTLALTAKKGSKKAFRVQPLVEEPAEDKEAKIVSAVEALIAELEAAADGPAYFAIIDRPDVQKRRAWLKANRPELAEKVSAASEAALERTKTPAE